jgi:hypothetical protein
VPRSIAAQVVSLWLRCMLAACFGLACAVNAAVAQGRNTVFNIPGEPLADALYAYSSMTGIEILVPEDTIARRRSAAIVGTFSPEEALRALLAGAGLAPRSTGINAFTLVPMTSVAASSPFVMPKYPDYSAALQAAVLGALCSFRETRPGDYRLAARLWVAPTGSVKRVAVLGTTGNTDRDATLSTLLEHVVVGQAPPADLTQPTTVVILPLRDAGVECVDKAVSVTR